ncbi:MAG TPA: DUF3263 domain-containing protein [Acidimicrobiales bacterium]|jgi:hypothetical protein|nr:DUF3263 domain-containing protein [Acidimicrobiales bacterium]
MPLTDRDRAILDFERTWWSEPGPKAAAIQARIGLSPARYYQLLSALIGSPDAAVYDPLVVRRLRRMRTNRRRARIEGGRAVQPRGR